MSERPTIDFEVPRTGKKFVLREYLTGGEMRRIEGMFIDRNKIEDGVVITMPIDSNVYNQSQNALIEMMVVSIDGKTENVVQEVLDLPKSDYDLLIVKLNELTAGDSKKKLS